MKDYIIQNQQLLITQSDYMTLARIVSKNTMRTLRGHSKLTR